MLDYESRKPRDIDPNFWKYWLGWALISSILTLGIIYLIYGPTMIRFSLVILYALDLLIVAAIVEVLQRADESGWIRSLNGARVTGLLAEIPALICILLGSLLIYHPHH